MTKEGSPQPLDWYITVTFTTETHMNSEAGFDILDALAEHHPSAALAANGGSISLTVSAPDAVQAAALIPQILAKAQPITGAATVVSLEILSEDAFQASLDEPEIPDLVGLTEIAEMAGVSRQRANAIVKQDSFPSPVLTLAAGQFRTRAAVQNWVENWTRKPGRKPNTQPTG